MDVPFRSSGASSRQHYALVRKVERASSATEADQHISAQVDAIRSQVKEAGISLKSCKELLIILLYCHSNVTSTMLSLDALHFAIPHALNLAEAGESVRDKRLGYLFCAEIMPANHELQLMLVNTLRKDLESPYVERICLALDNLISSCTDDMIPAIQPRLHDLLSHNSLHVRRRALLAFRALSRHDSDIMLTLSHSLFRRLKDPDPTISAAALLACSMYKKSDELVDCVNKLFSSSPHHQSRHWLLLCMRTLQTLGVNDIHGHVVVSVVHTAASHRDYPMLLQGFRLLDIIPEQSLTPTSIRSCVEDIRILLSSSDPNEQYTFLACLESLSPQYWAGTSPEIPAVLMEREVGRFMQMLDSTDSLTRRKAVTILNKVDRTIVSAYYTQSVENIPEHLTFEHKIEYACRLLEVLEAEYANDGEGYSGKIIGLFAKLDPPSAQAIRILDVAVEKILIDIRDNHRMFKMASATVLIGHMLEGNEIGSTLMVIVIALACEYCGDLSFQAEDVLNGLSSRLLNVPASIQDVCLIAMLRVSAECQHVSEDVRTVVAHCSKLSSRYLRKRCEQFLTLSLRKDELKKTLKSANSYSLPHVVEALITLKSPSATSPLSSPSTLSHQLRYAAYDSPSIPTQRPQTSASTMSESDSLRTMTPRELAKELNSEAIPLSSFSKPVTFQSSQASKADLIVFDTPFLTEAPSTEGFEAVWNGLQQSMASRGWFEGRLADFLARLEGVEMTVIPTEEPPFIGEAKVLLGPADACAAMRVKVSDEEGCLWRMRSSNAQLRLAVKRKLGDED